MVNRSLIAERRRLVVLDAHAHAHRAFHALDPMRAPDGLPTHALYGFAGLLRRIVIDDRPDYLAVVFDAPDDRRTTFRTALYPAYKSHRPPRAPELAAQIPLLRDVARAFNAPVLEDEGFEADDLIASVVALAEEHDLRTLVQSGDKDLLQLASARTTLWDAMRGRHYAPAAVEEKLGVPPSAVADFLALCGDSTDNVPGVPGIGPKTAAALLRAWGSLDGIYAALDTLPPRERARLEAHREVAYLSRALTRLRADVPIGTDLEAFALRAPDQDAIERLFTRLGFQSLIPPRRARPAHVVDVRPPSGDPTPAPRRSEPRTFAVHEPGAWSIALAAIDRCPLVGMALGPTSLGVATLSGEAFEVVLDTPTHAQRSLFDAPAGLPPAMVFDALAPILSAPGRAAIAHDALALGRRARLGRVDFDPALARRLLARAEDEAPTTAADAARRALRERTSLAQALADAGLDRLYREVELPLLPVLAAIEEAGVPVDPLAIERARAANLDARRRLEGEIHELAGRRFRIDDPKALGEILFGVLGLPALRHGKKGASVDAAALGELARAHPLPRAVLELQRLRRLDQDGLRPLASAAMRGPRLHARYDNLGPGGRATPDGPLAALLAALREATGDERARLATIVPTDRLLVIDLAQLDLRLAAHLSEDGPLCAACASDDPYATLAAELCGRDAVAPRERVVAKQLALGLVYGTHAGQVAGASGVSVREARALIAARDARHERLVAWQAECVRAAREAGHARSLLGRRRLLPELADERPALQKLGEGLAISTVVAGSAADVVKLTLVRLAPALVGAGRLVAVQGDLLLVEHEAGLADEVAARVARTLEAVTRELALAVPLMGHADALAPRERPVRPAGDVAADRPDEPGLVWA
ncbi:MAG: hypothetical protein IT385_24700 [Deltaproteobacteria bacterium]|nr:hypothetical protein [Deltaproteobacteria bacterium]